MIRFIKAFLCLTLLKTLYAIDRYEWVVIGAGPAGTISVAMLLESGIEPRTIAWIDPSFKVGRLGEFYGNVPSNQMAHRFTTFLNSCKIFKNFSSKSVNKIKNFNQQEEPLLQLLVDVLQDIATELRKRVTCYATLVSDLSRKDNDWFVTCLENRSLIAHKVILAHGSRPKKDAAYKEIPLDIALDESKLKKIVAKEDRVMVVGSAHSALLIVKYLSELPVKQVISLYTKPPTYGMYGGLEGVTARWTKEVLEKNQPKNIIRDSYTKEKFNFYAKKVDKIIYAYGFCQNVMIVDGLILKDGDFNPKTGVIRPGLFGIGIAFPELHTTQEGKTVPLIGVNSFYEESKGAYAAMDKIVRMDLYC